MSLILLHPEATQGMFFSWRKAGAAESRPNHASAFQALVQGISAHLICQIMSEVQAQHQWGGKHTPLLWMEGEGVHACWAIFHHILSSSTPLFCFSWWPDLWKRLPTHRVPSSSPPVLFPSPPMATATTTPLRPLWSRSPTPSTLSKPVDMFPFSSYVLHVSVAFHPGGSSLLLEFLSLWDFTPSPGPGFPLLPWLSLLISFFSSSPPAQWWYFSGLGLEPLFSTFSKLHHCSQSLRCLLCTDDSWMYVPSSGIWVFTSYLFSCLDGAVWLPCITLEVSTSKWNCLSLQ